MMAQRACCVPGCSMKLGGGLPLHRFPSPNNPAQIERFRTWVMKIGGDIIGEDNEFIHKNRKVCHKHFEDVYIFPNMKLTALAIPTLEIPENSYHQFPHPEKNPDRFKAWVHIAGGKLDSQADYELYRKKVICDIHFTNRDRNRNNRLNFLAVPSLHLPGKSDEVGTSEKVLLAPEHVNEESSLATFKPTLPVFAPATSRATGSTIDITQTPNASGVENTDICDDDDDADDDSDTLVESNVCRVCLAMDVKMYDLNNIELREMFQNITGIAVTENNHSILERLCWECAGRLKAAAAFRNQALLSYTLLQGLASTGEQIRKNDVTLIKENEDYLKSLGSLSAVEVFHIVHIDPENDSVPPISENNDTEIVQKKVRNDSIKQKKSFIEEDYDQMDVKDEESMIEAPITTEMEHDQFDHICRNTGEESSNIFLETNPVFTNNVPFREDKSNSANSSPLPSYSHVEPKHPILDHLKTTSDFEDKIKKPVIKITKRDSISKILFKNSDEVIRVLKGDAKLKNINVKIGGISKKTSNLKLVKKTQVKPNTPTDEESMRLEDLEF